ncbi:MAG: response regulator transcription factor [Pirellulales bacterium]
MSRPLRILVIEDDAPIRRGLVDALRSVGYESLEAAGGNRGLDLALTAEYDLLLLDLVLPELGGLEILERLRVARPTQAVIVLTARAAEHDRVAGLRAGADDYVVKPFGLAELLARVEAVLRRSPERPSSVVELAIPAGAVDLARREVRYAEGGRAELSEKECELLRYLAQHAGRTIAREELLAHVWGLSPRGVTTRTIDMHVARLREKLRDDRETPQVIVTSRGHGYAFCAAAPGPAP